ncbi:MAG: DUF3343 domain-containing protein [Candidatus Margulisiibacteriota bacterium]
MILLFDSIHQLLKTEKGLKKQGIKYEIIPTPREYSSDCGSAIKMKEELDKESKELVFQLVFKTSSGRIIPSAAGSIPALSDEKHGIR